MEQSNLLELAKQGEPEAIAALMNVVLKPKGITARARFEGGVLCVFLEAPKPLNQDTLVTFIRKGLLELNNESIQAVRACGKRTNEQGLAWTKDFLVHPELEPEQNPVTNASTYPEVRDEIRLASPTETAPAPIVPSISFDLSQSKRNAQFNAVTNGTAQRIEDPAEEQLELAEAGSSTDVEITEPLEASTMSPEMDSEMDSEMGPEVVVEDDSIEETPDVAVELSEDFGISALHQPEEMVEPFAVPTTHPEAIPEDRPSIPEEALDLIDPLGEISIAEHLEEQLTSASMTSDADNADNSVVLAEPFNFAPVELPPDQPFNFAPVELPQEFAVNAPHHSEESPEHLSDQAITPEAFFGDSILTPQELLDLAEADLSRDISVSDHFDDQGTGVETTFDDERSTTSEPVEIPEFQFSKEFAISTPHDSEESTGLPEAQAAIPEIPFDDDGSEETLNLVETNPLDDSSVSVRLEEQITDLDLTADNELVTIEERADLADIERSHESPISTPPNSEETVDRQKLIIYEAPSDDELAAIEDGSDQTEAELPSELAIKDRRELIIYEAPSDDELTATEEGFEPTNVELPDRFLLSEQWADRFAIYNGTSDDAAAAVDGAELTGVELPERSAIAEEFENQFTISDDFADDEPVIDEPVIDNSAVADYDPIEEEIPKPQNLKGWVKHYWRAYAAYSEDTIEDEEVEPQNLKGWVKHYWRAYSLPVVLVVIGGFIAGGTMAFWSTSKAQNRAADAKPEQPRDQSVSNKQIEAEKYLKAMNDAQKAFYEKNQRFATNLEELERSTNLKEIRFLSYSYAYRLRVTESPLGSPQSPRSVIVASPRETGLKGYIGAVFATPDGSPSIVCETPKASMEAPEPPQLVKKKATCAPRSTKVQ
jgi:hypothetical protein